MEYNSTCEMKKSKYEDLFRDPLYWKEKANRQFYSANILHEHLHELIKTFDNWTDEDDQHFISLMDSFFLLVALSFENLIKGLIISIELNIIDKKEYETKYGFNFNHNLIKMFSTNFRTLTDVEEELINRLQNYLRWMSKYPLPREKYINNEVYHGYKLSDPDIVKDLYTELSAIIDSNVEKDIPKYLTNRNK